MRQDDKEAFTDYDLVAACMRGRVPVDDLVPLLPERLYNELDGSPDGRMRCDGAVVSDDAEGEFFLVW